MNHLTFTGFIPARMGSTRFPGKPLALINGKPMILHVYQQVMKWEHWKQVFVLTPDDEICQACLELGIPCLRTGEASDCIDRAALGLQLLVESNRETDRYVIIQGDEPLFDCSILDGVDYSHDIINFSTPLVEDNEYGNMDIVKVLISNTNRAIYFSRADLPYLTSNRRTNRSILSLKQLGIYVFSKYRLQQFIRLQPSDYENGEGIGLNRLISYDIPIHMNISATGSISVDNPSDIQRVKEIINENNTNR